MPDKKLTDAEIVKALECCGRESCTGCPYRGNCHQGNPMIRDALSLINRLQADVDNYKQIAENQQKITMDRGFEIKRLKEKIESLQAENERLKKEKDEYAYLYDKHINTAFSHIKAEAYKECIEKVKKEILPMLPFNFGATGRAFDNLLKELVGEDNG